MSKSPKAESQLVTRLSKRAINEWDRTRDHLIPRSNFLQNSFALRESNHTASVS